MALTHYVRCDKCEKQIDLDDVVEWQEHMTWENNCGYGSVFGDGNQVRVDLCQQCTKEVLGPYIKTVGSYNG